MSSSFTMSAATPYTEHRDEHGHDDKDDRPHEDRLRRHLRQRDRHDLGGEDEVCTDRAADHRLLVRGAAELGDLLRGCRLVVTAPEHFVDLLGALERQVRAADHQQRRHEPWQELAQQQRDREDEDELVPQGALGNLEDDR